MRSPSLPDKIDPWQLALDSGRLEGELALAALPRLAALNVADGRVGVALAAGVDDGGQRFLEGRFRAELELVCQRCLGPLRLSVDVPVELGLLRSEAEISRLSARYEPLLVPDDGVVVADLVEDELLLALPQIPRHEDRRACEAGGFLASDAAPPDAAPPEAERRRPFSVLASLLPDLHRST